MKLVNEKIKTDEFYSVGYHSCVKQYIMVITISHWFWFERYYLINRDEYLWFENAPQKLSTLAADCYKEGIKHQRFYCSELTSENTSEQAIILKMLLTSE